MVYVLFFREQQASFDFQPNWMNKLSAMYGLGNIVINLKDDWPNPSEPRTYRFKTLTEARFHPELKNLRWVWMVPGVEENLSTFEHPKDNVVYAIGSDFDGFGDFPIPESDQLLALDETDEIRASICVHHVVYNRYLRM